MKKLLVSIVLACSVAGLQANPNMHVHPSVVNVPQAAAVAGEKTLLPGFCEIELANDYAAVSVYGTFDDGSSMQPFYFYPGPVNQYISLFYATPGQPAYCHAGMYLSIYRASDNYPLYNQFTSVQSSIYITSSPYLKAGKAEATVIVK